MAVLNTNNITMETTEEAISNEYLDNQILNAINQYAIVKNALIVPPYVIILINHYQTQPKMLLKKIY